MQSTSSIVLLVLSLSACVFQSQQQLIDLDLNHWTRYVFAEGTATVTLKIPPGFRTINSSLPELTYKGAQRLLLDAQYDFGKGASSHTSQFEIKVNFAHLHAIIAWSPNGSTDAEVRHRYQRLSMLHSKMHRRAE
jgi:hypothetical protein